MVHLVHIRVWGDELGWKTECVCVCVWIIEFDSLWNRHVRDLDRRPRIRNNCPIAVCSNGGDPSNRQCRTVDDLFLTDIMAYVAVERHRIQLNCERSKACRADSRCTEGRAGLSVCNRKASTSKNRRSASEIGGRTWRADTQRNASTITTCYRRGSPRPPRETIRTVYVKTLSCDGSGVDVCVRAEREVIARPFNPPPPTFFRVYNENVLLRN